MRRPFCYDITRLLTRILNATPNGIDRIDHVLAQHFLAGGSGAAFGSVFAGIGPRLLEGEAARAAVSGIAAHWGEDASGSPEDDPLLRHVIARIVGTPSGDAPVPTRPKRRRAPIPVAGIGAWIARHGLPLTRSPAADLPQNGVYINVSQFPLWRTEPFEWLERRRDVRAVFFVHDLLPIILPEYFRAAEFERHQRRLRNVARFASAAIVTTQTVAGDLRTHLAGLGRTDLPIFVAPTPISPLFATERRIEPALRGHPFFVFCSTLEPRKNHLMILAVWRELAARLGRAVPKLVLVGTRGWHFDPIIDLIERSPALRDSVIEVNGLSTPGLKRLIDNAEAVLMPSFGEGYGLPVHEALVAGTPVIASDVPAFREISSDALTRLSPLDGEAWAADIQRRVASPREDGSPSPAPASGWTDYFAALDDFIATL